MDELENLRPMLDRRYEEVRSGKVKPISGDEVEAYFRKNLRTLGPNPRSICATDATDSKFQSED